MGSSSFCLDTTADSFFKREVPDSIPGEDRDFHLALVYFADVLLQYNVQDIQCIFRQYEELITSHITTPRTYLIVRGCFFFSVVIIESSFEQFVVNRYYFVNCVKLLDVYSECHVYYTYNLHGGLFHDISPILGLRWGYVNFTHDKHDFLNYINLYISFSSYLNLYNILFQRFFPSKFISNSGCVYVMI